MARDKYNLNRFIEAQENIYPTALKELQDGHKRSHWMWFIFPQVIGLGHTTIANHYAIVDIDEAREYLAHPILGARLREVSQVLLKLETDDAYAVFGSPDNLKLRSCMTLFDNVSPNDVFAQVLDKYYDGQRDFRTIRILQKK